MCTILYTLIFSFLYILIISLTITQDPKTTIEKYRSSFQLPKLHRILKHESGNETEFEGFQLPKLHRILKLYEIDRLSEKSFQLPKLHRILKQLLL